MGPRQGPCVRLDTFETVSRHTKQFRDWERARVRVGFQGVSVIRKLARHLQYTLARRTARKGRTPKPEGPERDGRLQTRNRNRKEPSRDEPTKLLRSKTVSRRQQANRENPSQEKSWTGKQKSNKVREVGVREGKEKREVRKETSCGCDDCTGINWNGLARKRWINRFRFRSEKAFQSKLASLKSKGKDPYWEASVGKSFYAVIFTH